MMDFSNWQSTKRAGVYMLFYDEYSMQRRRLHFLSFYKPLSPIKQDNWYLTTFG